VDLAAIDRFDPRSFNNPKVVPCVDRKIGRRFAETLGLWPLRHSAAVLESAEPNRCRRAELNHGRNRRFPEIAKQLDRWEIGVGHLAVCGGAIGPPLPLQLESGASSDPENQSYGRCKWRFCTMCGALSSGDVLECTKPDYWPTEKLTRIGLPTGGPMAKLSTGSSRLPAPAQP